MADAWVKATFSRFTELVDGAGAFAGNALKSIRVNAGATALEYYTPTAGTVTSVGLVAPGIFTVTGSPVTSSGSLSFALANQNANLVWCGPATGTAAPPTFRSLVAADIPALAYVSSTTTRNVNTFLAGPTSGAAAAPTFRTLVQADLPVQPWTKLGLRLSGTGSTNVLSITAGRATDNTNAAIMILGAAFTKTTAAWAAGSGNGGLDTGSVGGNFYFVYLIAKADLSAVDVLFSLSSTAPTMPATYTLKRRIGVLPVNGSGFWYKGFMPDDHTWRYAVHLDTALVFTTTNAVLTTVAGVPVGLKLKIAANYFAFSSTATTAFWIYDGDQDNATSLTSVIGTTPAIGAGIAGRVELWTNTSGQVRIIASGANTSGTLFTDGWYDPMED